MDFFIFITEDNSLIVSLSRHGKGAAKPAPWGAANDNGAWAKCALLSGPPGVGKTTTSYLVAQELGSVFHTFFKVNLVLARDVLWDPFYLYS